MRRYIALITLMAAAWGLSPLTPPASAARQPCAADAAKFCKGVRPGGGRISKCFRAHRAQLSEACKAHRRGELEARRQKCQSDLEKFCKEVRPGKGNLARCLRQHQAELSPACRAAVSAPRQ